MKQLRPKNVNFSNVAVTDFGHDCGRFGIRPFLANPAKYLAGFPDLA